MSAPLKNQNATKEESDKATSFLHIRVTPRDKASFVKAAQREGSKLAEWVIDRLRRAAN